MKINNVKHFTVAIAYLLCGSVVLSGAHAKDLVKHTGSDLSSHTVKTFGDVSAKALSDLHNHTDKTTLKHFAKSASDNATMARQRELKADTTKTDKSWFGHLADAFLYWRLAFSLR